MAKYITHQRRIFNLEVIIAIIFILISIITSVIFYFYLIDFHANNLKKNLVTIAKTAVLQVNGDILADIKTPADMEKPEYKELVAYLNSVRDSNNDIRFIYLMRKTDNPDLLSFIVDADSLKSQEELDENKNGIIEKWEEASLPGDKYSIVNMQSLKKAFQQAIADEDITTDQWGKFISGYAPIFNSQGEAVAILGLDLKAEDYYRLQKRTNMALFILVSIFSLIIAIIFILVWQHKKEIKILNDVDKQKSDFISLASHQLRTPLSASKWSIDMLQHGDFGKMDTLQKNVIAHLCSVNEQMVQLVDDLFKVSQTDSKSLHAKYANIDLKLFCKKVNHLLEYLRAERNIKFSFVFDDKIKHIKSDPRLLQEVLINLLNNAFRYTPHGSPVSFTVKKYFAEIIFEIKDNGYGIPADEQKRIFTKFFRGTNILKKEPGCTGLGLYFVKKIVELLGGRIDFTSREGSGSTFYFYLPDKE